MDDDVHDIDKLFYDALEPAQQQPAENVWGNISAGLDKNASGKRMGYIGTKQLLSLAVVLIFGTIGIVKYNQSTTKEAKIKNGTSFSQTQTFDNKGPIAFQKKAKNSFDDTSTRNLQNTNPSTNNHIEKKQVDNEDFHSNKNKTQYKNAISHDKNPINTIGKNNMQSGNDNGENDKSVSPPDAKYDRKIAWENGFNDKNRNVKINGNLNTQHISAGTSNIGETIANNGQNNDGQTSFGERGLLLKSTIANDFTILTQRALHSIFIPSRLLKTQTPIVLLSHTLTEISSSKKSNIRSRQNRSRFYISVFGAQEWQGYALQDNDDNMVRQTGNDKKSIGHREDGDPSPAAGINLGYRIGKKFSLETGIRFGGYHIRTDSAKIFAVNNSGDVQYKLTTSSGYAYLKGISGNLPMAGDSTTAQKVRQSINYVGIPILLRYRVSKGKFSFNPALGLTFNFITHSSVSANLDNGQSKVMQSVSLRGLSKFSAVAMFNPSIYYQVGKNVSVGLEPYASYSISPISNTNVVKSFPYGLGLGAGVKYSF